jgi:hypothetical protein
VILTITVRTVSGMLLAVFVVERAGHLCAVSWLSNLCLQVYSYLCTGVELIVDPAILLLDEPSSGLDSYIALQLIGTLKQACCPARVACVCPALPALHVPLQLSNAWHARPARTRQRCALQWRLALKARREIESPPGRPAMPAIRKTEG